MATISVFLRRRVNWLATVSIVTMALLGIWLLRSNTGEKALPEMGIITPPKPRVTLRQGTIIGIEVENGLPQVLEEFLGIPYALPPTGARRFRPPVRVNASADEFDAGKYGYRCLAGPRELNALQDEDCLSLNIYRPKIRDEGNKLPVVVHIHGGAFNSGAGNTRTISSLVAWSPEQMIGVSFNYRIGAFGFLPSKLTAKESLLNIGLKDQALLFEWVQENIAEFGGDPDEVTLMGNSAGAHSIGHHLMLNTGKPPPFNKAIVESGAATARAVYSFSNPLHEQQMKEFLILLGCEDVPEEHIMDTLRSLKAVEIKKASETIFNKYNPSVRWPFQPVIDGEDGVIPIRPIDAWRSGKWHKVPTLTGFNTNEGAMFVPEKASSTSKQFTNFFRTLLPGLSEDDLTKLDEVYPDPTRDPSSKYVETRKGLGAQFKRMEQAYGHFAYIAPVRQTVHFATAANAPIYLYHFAVNCSIKGGADHGTHAPFVTYDREIRDVSDDIDDISGTMHAYWTSFIATGDPNAVKGRYPDRPQWPAYLPGSGKVVMFGEGNDEIAGGDNTGTVVQVTEDTYAAEESEYWWARTELFEL